MLRTVLGRPSHGSPEGLRYVRYVAALSLALVLTLSGVARTAGGAPSDPLPTATPASQGFNAARLERVHARMRRFVDDQRHAGIVTLIARNGRIVDWQAWGQRDVERRLPMEKDTIVRIYSMSKIITSVAVMALHEEGRIKLDDPASKYLPALAKPRVFKGGTAKAPVVAPARTPITIKHLLTHTSGFSYGFGNGPLDKIYQQANLADSTSLDDFVSRAAKLPLAEEPGTRFRYGINVDILGAIVEKVSGQRFEDFVEERVCRPLGMRDTGYHIPPEKMSRLARLYEHPKPAATAIAKATAVRRSSMRRRKGTNGGAATDFVEAKPVWTFAEKGRGFAAGGAGMFSTIGDYARFAQMLLNGGELDGVRILGRKTVELMTANHLSHLPRHTHEFSDADGFGLGVQVRVDLARSSQLGSVGQFGWSGAATTTVTIDPKERLVALVFTQHFPHNEHDLFWNFTTLAYQALE